MALYTYAEGKLIEIIKMLDSDCKNHMDYLEGHLDICSLVRQHVKPGGGGIAGSINPVDKDLLQKHIDNVDHFLHEECFCKRSPRIMNSWVWIQRLFQRLKDTPKCSECDNPATIHFANASYCSECIGKP